MDKTAETKSRHTPGPWEALSNVVRTARTPDGDGGCLVATCPPSVGCRLADARLIAAAPQMLEALLEACRDVRADLEYGAPYPAWYASAVAAIAAAEGR